MSNITERVDGEFALAAGASVWWGVWWTPHRFIVVVPESLHAAHGHKLKYTDHYVQRFVHQFSLSYDIRVPDWPIVPPQSAREPPCRSYWPGSLLSRP